MIGIVYAIESKLPRRVIVTDDGVGFAAACVLGDGESLIVRDSIADGTLETLRTIIAAETGLAVDDQPSGRCAVVVPETREVVDFIVADPALDTIPADHPVGVDVACELHASDDAKLGDKIMEDGERLARVVTGDRDGVVVAVDWIAPDAIPEGHVEDSHAQVGDVVEALKLTDVPAEGAVKL